MIMFYFLLSIHFEKWIWIWIVNHIFVMDWDWIDNPKKLDWATACKYLTCIRSFEDTVCFTNVDLGSEMIIFEPILTAFEESFIFWDTLSSRKNWFELKNEPSIFKFSLP